MTANAPMWAPVAVLLVLVRLLQRIADLEDAVAAARATVEAQQDEHQQWRLTAGRRP